MVLSTKKRGVATIYDANLSHEYVEKLQAFNNKLYAHQEKILKEAIKLDKELSLDFYSKTPNIQSGILFLCVVVSTSKAK